MSFKQNTALQFITFLISLTFFCWFMVLSTISVKLMEHLNLNWTILFTAVVTISTITFISSYVKLYILPTLENKSKLKEIISKYEREKYESDDNN